MNSAYAYCGGGGSKKTFIYLEDLPCAEKFDEEELNLFLKYGETDIKKTEKTKEEIEKDKNVRIGTLEEVDPHILCTFNKSAIKTEK